MRRSNQLFKEYPSVAQVERYISGSKNGMLCFPDTSNFIVACKLFSQLSLSDLNKLEAKYGYSSMRSVYDKLISLEFNICKKQKSNSYDSINIDRPMYDLPMFRNFRNTVFFKFTSDGEPLPHLNTPDNKYASAINADGRVIIENQEYLFDHSSIYNLAEGTIIYKKIAPNSKSENLDIDKCNCKENATSLTGPVIFEEGRFINNPNYNPSANPPPTPPPTPPTGINYYSGNSVDPRFTNNPDLALHLSSSDGIRHFTRSALSIGAPGGLNWFDNSCKTENGDGNGTRKQIHMTIDIQQNWDNTNNPQYARTYWKAEAIVYEKIAGSWFTHNRNWLNLEIHSWAPSATNMFVVAPVSLTNLGFRNFHLNTNFYNGVGQYICYFAYSPATLKEIKGESNLATQNWSPVSGILPMECEVWTLGMPHLESVSVQARIPVRSGTAECIRKWNC